MHRGSVARRCWPWPHIRAGGALLLLLAGVLSAEPGGSEPAPVCLPGASPELVAWGATAAPLRPPRAWEPGGLGLLYGMATLPDQGAYGAARPVRHAAPLPHRHPQRGEVLHLPAGAAFQSDLERLLPRYRADFEAAARQSGLDWRLLAAMGYQESRWDPAARSRTGVRGLMMLTQDTALDLGVDREDARQSILGAGRFLQALYGQLPPQIREPDRTAMVLAAYNQGLGHLQDARDVADLRGGDPNRWADVRQALPLLSRELWVQTTKYGSARGAEAVGFVDGVHGYYARLQALTPEAAPTIGAGTR